MGLPRGFRTASRSSSRREGEGTGVGRARRSRRRARDGAAPRSVVVLSGDQPLITARAAPGAPRGARPAGRRRHAAHHRPARSGRLRADRARRRTATSSASSRRSTPRASSTEELAVREINLGTYVFDANTLFEALDQVGLERDERYLTGVFPVIRENGGTVAAHMTDDADAAIGVNDRVGLMSAEEAAQRRLIEEHARAGVTFLQPGTTRVEAGVTIGRDTVIGPGTVLEGSTSIGERCEVGRTLRRRHVRDAASIVIGTTSTPDRPVRLPPARHGRARGRQGRHLRRDQELRHRRRREGAAPLLHRRRRRRRGQQPRRQHHHRELRRQAEAPHEARKEREDEHPHVAGRAPRTSATGRTLALARRSPRTSRRALWRSRGRNRRTSRVTRTARSRRTRRNEQAPRAHGGAAPAPAASSATYEKRLMLTAGRASMELGGKIAEKLGVEPIDAGLKTFPDGEVYCRYEESIRGARHLHRPVDLRLRARGPDGQRRARGAAC